MPWRLAGRDGTPAAKRRLPPMSATLRLGAPDPGGCFSVAPGEGPGCEPVRWCPRLSRLFLKGLDSSASRPHARLRGTHSLRLPERWHTNRLEDDGKEALRIPGSGKNRTWAARGLPREWHLRAIRTPAAAQPWAGAAAAGRSWCPARVRAERGGRL